MDQDVERVLLTREQVEERISQIAEEISNAYQGEPILMVCILRGAVLFYADLVRKIRGDVRFDFMSVSSYGSGAVSSGKVNIKKDLAESIEGKNVVLVEDIIDSGNTLGALKEVLLARKPKSLKICAMLDKPERRERPLEGDWVGFRVPNEFVVGYGLDYDEKYRALPDVCVLKREIYGG